MKKDLDDKRGELKSEYDNIDEKYKTELIKVKVSLLLFVAVLSIDERVSNP